MSPVVTIPLSGAAPLKGAALEELRGTLEVIRCSAWLAARAPLAQRERRLLVAIDMAAERAQRALRRLQG